MIVMAYKGFGENSMGAKRFELSRYLGLEPRCLPIGDAPKLPRRDLNPESPDVFGCYTHRSLEP